MPATIEKQVYWARAVKLNKPDDITLHKDENSNSTIKIEGHISPSFA